MSRSTAAAIQELLDRVAIHDVMLRYARGIDRKDLDLVASLFTPDCAYEGALGSGTIATALAALHLAIERYESTMHLIGNQLIEIEGDQATSETYAIAYHRLTVDAQPTMYTVAVRYVDDLVRREGRWLICRRVVTSEWQRTETVSAK